MSKFSSREICAIIKTCGEAGVLQLTIGELSISFAPAEVGQPRQEQAPTGPWGSQYPLAENPNLHPAEMGSQEEQQAFVTQHEELVEHLRHAELLLDDPDAYEQTRMDELFERASLTGGHA